MFEPWSGLKACLLDKYNLVEVPKDYREIQKAIEKKSKNDLIYVHPGWYKEDLKMSNKDLVLIGPNSRIPGHSPYRKREAIINGSVNFLNESCCATFDGFKILENIIVKANEFHFKNNILSNKDCQFQDTKNRKLDGLTIEMSFSTESVNISKNYFKGYDKGIFADGENHGKEDIKVSNNLIVQNIKGIHISLNKNSLNIKNNVFFGNINTAVELSVEEKMKRLNFLFNRIQHNKGNGLVLTGKDIVSKEIIKNNNFGNNSCYSLINDLKEKICATCNYWGNKVPNFKDTIRGEVEYVPWLKGRVEKADLESK